MKASNLKKELDVYISLLTAKQQNLLLEMAKGLLHIDSEEKRISVEKYNEELDASIQQVREGKVIYHEDLLKDMEKW